MRVQLENRFNGTGSIKTECRRKRPSAMLAPQPNFQRPPLDNHSRRDCDDLFRRMLDRYFRFSDRDFSAPTNANLSPVALPASRAFSPSHFQEAPLFSFAASDIYRAQIICLTFLLLLLSGRSLTAQHHSSSLACPSKVSLQRRSVRFFSHCLSQHVQIFDFCVCVRARVYTICSTLFVFSIFFNE